MARRRNRIVVGNSFFDFNILITNTGGILNVETHKNKTCRCLDM